MVSRFLCYLTSIGLQSAIFSSWCVIIFMFGGAFFFLCCRRWATFSGCRRWYHWARCSLFNICCSLSSSSPLSVNNKKHGHQGHQLEHDYELRKHSEAYERTWVCYRLNNVAPIHAIVRYWDLLSNLKLRQHFTKELSTTQDWKNHLFLRFLRQVWSKL